MRFTTFSAWRLMNPLIPFFAFSFALPGALLTASTALEALCCALRPALFASSLAIEPAILAPATAPAAFSLPLLIAEPTCFLTSLLVAPTLDPSEYLFAGSLVS